MIRGSSSGKPLDDRRNNSNPYKVSMTDRGNETNGEANEDDCAAQRKVREGEDYYLENGLMVFTAAFLKERGYCCESGCRHCPFGFVKTD